MNVFDIKDSIIKPFGRIDTNGGFFMPQPGSRVENYVSRNLPCGNTDFYGLRTMLDASNSRINEAGRGVSSLLSVVDRGASSALSIARLAAGIMDGISALSGKLGSMGAMDKLQDISLSKPDLNIGCGPADAAQVRSMVTDIGDKVGAMKQTCLDTMNSFTCDDDTSAVTVGDDELIIPLEEDAISGIDSMMECQGTDVLGLLSLGLTNLISGSFSGSGLVNPMSGVVSALGAVQGGLMNSLTNTAGNAMGGVLGSAYDKIGEFSPEVAGFVQNMGLPSLLASALGGNLLGGFNGSRSYSACQSAQRMNRYGNYDPLITQLLNLTGMGSGNRNVYGSGGYNNRYGMGQNNYCQCCTQKKYPYQQQERYAMMDRSYYDFTPGYFSSTNSNGSSSSFYRSGRTVPDDEISRIVQQYGFNEDNVLTGTLGTSLEGYRVSRQLEGNISELNVDFSKFVDFESQSASNLTYLRGLAEDNAVTNLAHSEDLTESVYELFA